MAKSYMTRLGVPVFRLKSFCMIAGRLCTGALCAGHGGILRRFRTPIGRPSGHRLRRRVLGTNRVCARTANARPRRGDTASGSAATGSRYASDWGFVLLGRQAWRSQASRRRTSSCGSSADWLSPIVSLRRRRLACGWFGSTAVLLARLTRSCGARPGPPFGGKPGSGSGAPGGGCGRPAAGLLGLPIRCPGGRGASTWDPRPIGRRPSWRSVEAVGGRTIVRYLGQGPPLAGPCGARRGSQLGRQ